LIVNANIDIFEISYEESISYFKRLENLEKIRRTNGPSPALLPVDNKKRVSVTSSVGNPSKNHKEFNMWCQYCEKNNHNKVDCRVNVKFKEQKKNHFEAKAGPGKKSLALLLKKINALKRQLTPEKTASSKKKKAESILSTEINSTNSSDEHEGEEDLFTSSKPFSTSKAKPKKIISLNH
jgi:hypothetical protein